MGEAGQNIPSWNLINRFIQILHHLRSLCEVFRLWETDGGCPSELLPGQEAPLPQQLI
ncbi:hypothetical protein CGCSCA5_v011396 [Colletotrichum siamense]|nr:hypothetical protein CGCSCA5_v011396 [Colletotrichum siamense]